jgi:hypothetical protein
MRLGGASHKNISKSLKEFHHSSVMHGANPIKASYYLTRQLIIQNLINIDSVKSLLLSRRKNKET